MQTINLTVVSNTISKQAKQDCEDEIQAVLGKFGFKNIDEFGEDDPFLNKDIVPLGDGQPTEQEIVTYDTQVQKAWIDYNGHMTESSYTLVSGYAYDAFARYVGIDQKYRQQGLSFYTVENHGLYIRECKAGDKIYITTRLLGVDSKRMHLFHSYYKGKSGTLLFTIDQMMLHVDMNAGSVAPISDAVLLKLQKILKAQSSLELPELASRKIKMETK